MNKYLPAGSITAVNVTSSSHKDQKSQIEDELQNNKTSTVITEDDGEFFY